MMGEYELLRAEIINHFDHITQYNSILYTSVAAIFVFAFDAENPVLFLVSYIIILPIYLLIEKERESICRISSYMLFFLEGNEYHWETRLDMDDKMGTLGIRMPSAKKSKFVEYISVYSHWPFILISFICSAFSTYYTLLSNLQGSVCNIHIKMIAILAIWALFVFALLIMIVTVTQWGQFKEKFIHQWEQIKVREEIEAHKNHCKTENCK